ncbi:MAG: hypothetical protein ACXAAO_06665 [Candidatus Thorarchaeota archaeon]|jgi:hypothetical protein
MQVEVQWASELLMAIGLFLGTGLLIRFTLNRIKSLPEEERSLGRPLWIATIGVLLLGLASLLNYSYALGLGTLDTLYFVVAMVGAGFLALSAAMILGWSRGQFVPLVLIIVGVVIAFLVPTFGMPSFITWSVVGMFTLILFGAPFVLFTYLAKSTGRISSFAFAIVLITYPLFPIMSTFTSPEIVAIILALRLYGPALLITGLILPETNIGGELLAYGMTISSLLYFMTYLIISPIIVDIVMVLTVSFIALASVLGIGTAAYTFTRWRQSRNPATLTIGTYFFIGGFSFLIVALNNIEFIAGLNAEYVALLLGITAPMILNLSSIMALEWRQAILLPVLIFAAPFFLILTGWTAQPIIAPDLLPYRAIVMAITGILQSVIPLGLYGLLWWRMRKAGAPGRSRALFLMLGIIFLIFGTGGGDAVTLFASLSILTAFVVWWLGITGRADTLLKTAAS